MIHESPKPLFTGLGGLFGALAVGDLLLKFPGAAHRQRLGYEGYKREDGGHQKITASIRCVVPQARMKATNSQKIARKGTSFLRTTK
jgi:hypothetical protein